MRKIKILLASLALMMAGLTACQQGNVPTKNDNNNVTEVTFDTYTKSIDINESFTLNAKVSVKEGTTYESGIKWTTSNLTICTVNDGLVTAKSSGVAYISAIAGYKIATCAVVVANGQVSPTENTFVLNKSSLTIRPEKEEQLFALLNGSKVNPTWTTSDASIATISEFGNLKAINEGVTTITAKYESYTASCSVTVNKDAVEEPYLTLSSANISVGVGNQVILDASTNAVGEIKWESSNVNVATCIDGVIKGYKAGNCNVTASVAGLNAICSVTVTENSEEDKNVTVYFFLDYNNVDEEDTTGTKLLAKFKWYQNVPLRTCQDVPNNPSVPSDPAFPYFIGWSSHTIIDRKADLWDLDNDICGSSYHLYLYGIWSDTKEFSL